MVGRRFFSDTLVIPEPFVEDELSFPSVLHIRRPGTDTEPRTLGTRIGAEIKKRLTPSLELSVAGALTVNSPDQGPTLTGFDNLEIGLKYQVVTSALHEAVLSAALGWELGGTGRKATGAESFDVLNPAVLVGKGLGDLPSTLSVLKPLAVTGALGARIPTQASTKLTIDQSSRAGREFERHPNMLQWGGAIEYSLPYLEAYVKDLGLPTPVKQMFPLVEVDLQTPLDRGAAGKTTGTVNPGVVWAGQSVQVGVEAVFPINDRAGRSVGVRAFVRIDLERFLPALGQPLFGR